MTIDARHIRVKSGGGLETDGDELKKSSAGKTKVSMGSNGSMAHNSLTIVTFDTEDIDDLGFFTGPSNQLVADEDCTVLVVASMAYAGESTTGDRLIYIYHNGASAESVSFEPIGTGVWAAGQCMAVIKMSQGDTLNVYGFHRGGVNVTYRATMQVTKL